MPITTEHDWEEFQAPLKQFIRKRVPDDAIAEDLLQDVFLNIHLHIETLTHLKQLESWIYQLMRTAIAQYDRQRMSTISVELPEVPQLPEHLPDNDIITELFPAVQVMVSLLPKRDRQALVLTEYQGLTQKEFGERLGLSFSGAKSRVQRARVKLKQMLLECCHVELNRRGHVMNYQPACQCCATRAYCEDEPR